MYTKVADRGPEEVGEERRLAAEEFDVPRRSRKSCSACSGRCDEVVELESPETGTPLPEIYQPAPALG